MLGMEKHSDSKMTKHKSSWKILETDSSAKPGRREVDGKEGRKAKGGHVHLHSIPFRRSSTTIYRRMAGEGEKRSQHKGASRLNKLPTINVYVKYWMKESPLSVRSVPLSRVIMNKNMEKARKILGKFMYMSTIFHHNEHISVAMW